MKRIKFYILALPFLFMQRSFACDVCGAFMGVVPYDNQSSISFLHRYRVFNGYRNYQSTTHFFPSGAYKTMHNPVDSVVKNYSSADYESFKVYELRGKYFIHRRLELNFFVPFMNNKSKEDSSLHRVTGLGDMNFFTGYHIMRPSDESDFKQRLIVVCGVKLPTGSVSKKANHHGRIHFMMQPGTGSTDLFFYSTYTLCYKKIGISTTGNYKINGTNVYHERLGNSFANFSSVFFMFKRKNWIFIPSANSYYEFTNGLYTSSLINEKTKMNEWMCGAGFEVYYKNLGLNVNIQKTIAQQTAIGNLKSVGRLFTTLTYNFNQNRYLIKNTKKSKPEDNL